MKKFILGAVWCVVFYFLACAVVGGIIGGRAGARHPNDIAMARFEAQQDAIRIVSAARIYLFLGAVSLTLIGSTLGILPGTYDRVSPGANA